MKAWIPSTLALLLPLGCVSFAEEDDGFARHSADAAGIVLRSRDMSRTSAFFVDQVIAPNRVKGVLGEAYAHNSYMKAHPKAVALTPRTGPQGLDHVFIDTNPKTGGLMVVTGESKANTSRLGMTIDGRQMSPKWTTKRLDGMGKRYQAYGDPSKVVATGQRMPLNCKHSVDVPLPDGRHVHFFKSVERDGVLFTGTRQELDLACKSAQEYGRLLREAAAGDIPTGSLLFHTDTNTHVLKTYSLGPDGKREIGRIPLKDLRYASAPGDFRENLAKELQKAHPWMSDDVARTQANILAKERSLRDFVAGKSGSVLRESAKFGALALLLDGGINCIAEGKVGVEQFINQDTLTRATLMASGTAADFALQRVLLKSNIIPNALLRGNTGTVARTLGKTFGSTGGAATMLLFAAYDIFQYNMGHISGRELSANLVSGGAGVVAGALASAGTVSLVAMYGAASTGTAIASLSGAAATNATLAYLGGGSLAAGGFGVTGGMVVLSGGAFIAFVAVGWGVYKCCQWYFESQDFQDLGTEIKETRKLPSLLIFDTH